MLEVINCFNIENKDKLNYILNLPNDYYLDTTKSFPIILFLHGIGERGNDINLVKKFGIHRYIEDMDIPFIVISPQCHPNNFWDTHFSEIEKLIEEIQSNYRVDKNRICLVGISLGAYGTWNFVMQRPNLISSVVSIAGGSMLPKYASWIKDIPCYIAHGEKDTEVNLNESLEIYDALINSGGQVTLKTFKDNGHELCTKIFEEADLYKWIADNT